MKKGIKMKKTYLLAAASILCWSSVATVSKLLLNSLSSYQLLMFSSLFASVALLITNIITGKIKLLKNYKFRDYMITTLVCSLGTLFYYVFLYSGTERMAASQAFIINYLWPIMSVIFSMIILKERLTPRRATAILLSFLGVLTVAGEDLIKFNTGTLVGALLCVLAAVSYGLFTALNRKFDYDYTVSMMISFFATFLTTLVINLVMKNPFAVSVPELFGFMWNGFFVMALATVTWALALKYGGTARVSNLAYITPFLSLVWTFLILDEPIKPMSILGLVIIVVGIFIQLKDGKHS